MRSHVNILARKPRGFTLVELTMGLVITTMVMGALAAFSYAMSTAWRASDSAQSLFVTGNQAVARIQSIVRSSKKIGLVRTGSLSDPNARAACAMLWRKDSNADNKIQFSEIALLSYENNNLYYYDVQFPATMTQAQRDAVDTAVGVVSADLNDSTAPEDFKSLSYVVGNPVIGKKIIGADDLKVTGAQFATISNSTMRPCLEFALQLSKGSAKSTYLYGIAAVRSANGSPGN